MEITPTTSTTKRSPLGSGICSVLFLDVDGVLNRCGSCCADLFSVLLNYRKTMNLDHLQTAIEIHLEKIEKIMGPNYKLTLIASHNGAGDLKDADLVLTMADRAAVMKAVNRFLPENNKDLARRAQDSE